MHPTAPPDAAPPQLLGNIHQVTAAAEGDSADRAGGALWRLDAQPRQLDANVVRLPAGKRIEAHVGPDLDVLMLVLEGFGQVEGTSGAVAAEPGALIWLPRRSRRSIVAGGEGMAYLTAHPHRPGLSVGQRPADPPA